MEDQNKKHVYSRRQFLRASALVATSVAAVACSPAAATTPASNPTAAGAAPAAEPTATVAAPAAAAPEPTPTTAIGEYGSGEPVILWTGLGGADGATFAEMLKMYTEKNAGKAVRSETYGWDTLYQKLPTATAAGTPPDTTVFHETEIEQFTTQGLLQPLDDIMYSTGLVPVDDFAEPVMKALTVDGKKMCVPFDNHGWVCYLNTKVVKDSGLDPAVMPKNGEEFIQWAQKVTVDESGKHPTEFWLQQRQDQGLRNPFLVDSFHHPVDHAPVWRQYDLRRQEKEPAQFRADYRRCSVLARPDVQVLRGSPGDPRRCQLL